MIFSSISYEQFHICDALDLLAWFIKEITGDIRRVYKELRKYFVGLRPNVFASHVFH